MLKDEIEYRKISQQKLAEQMGISYKMLNDLLNGRRTLTIATALMFEAALDTPADSLMRLQLKYNSCARKPTGFLAQRFVSACQRARATIRNK